MSEVQELLQRYQAIRQRLYYPPNAVKDEGIDLKRVPSIRIPEPPSSEIVLEQVIQVEISPPPPPLVPLPKISIAAILAGVAHWFNLVPRDLRGEIKYRRVSFPRQIAFYLTIKLTGMAIYRIARHVGFDHTTLMYARDNIQRLIDTDPNFAALIIDIQDGILARHYG